jgi:hypothetical protein
MEIAKYIGLFLQKNNYCCLQGLGNLEIKKIPAQHIGTELVPASYQTKLNPIGSLDDAFPNFVATNEQVSIAKASNEISEFVRDAKTKLANGAAIEIPSVGQYFMANNILQFSLDPAFSTAQKAIVFPVAEKQQATVQAQNKEDKPYESYTNFDSNSSHTQVNWGMIGFWASILLISAGILFWGVHYYMQQGNNPEQVVSVAVAPTIPNTAVVTNNKTIDSSAQQNAPIAATNDSLELNFVIQSYKSMAAAQKREKKLNSYGYNVHITMQDSSHYLIVKSIKTIYADSTKMKDSLSRTLNPAGVSILK